MTITNLTCARCGQPFELLHLCDILHGDGYWIVGREGPGPPYARGGLVQGPGGEDTIPVRLMPGEHWHTAGQVRRWGQPAKDQDSEDGPGGIAQIAPEPFSGPPPP